MIQRMILLGGAGDLSRRLLLPALADLEARGALPAGLEVVAAGHSALDDASYREEIRAALDEHASEVDATARDAVVERCSFRRVDAHDAEGLQKLVSEGEGPVLVYFALPSDLVADAAAAIAQVTLPCGSRIAVEKPVGHDLTSAKRIEDVLGAFEPRAVLRVDHFLGLPAVKELMLRRVHDHHLDAVLDREHVSRVEITWDESLALEGRAAYYDAAGALRDMIQSHMIQLMSLVGMDRPACADDAFVRREKLELLSAVRLPGDEDVPGCVVRAQYEAGEIDGRRLPSYVDEKGVDRDRATETFVELTLHVDSRRWRGVPFVLRTGKALGTPRKEIRIVFRREAQDQVETVHGVRDHVLCIPIDDVEPGGSELPAYAEVVRSALLGDGDLSLSGTEVLASWAIVEPYLRAFARGAVPMQRYAAGSAGPEAKTSRHAARIAKPALAPKAARASHR